MLSTTRSNTPRRALRFDFGFPAAADKLRSDFGLDCLNPQSASSSPAVAGNPQLLRSLFLIAASLARFLALSISRLVPSLVFRLFWF